MFIIPLLAAIVPALVILWYFHSRDAFPEPAGLLWATFGLGVLSLIPAVLAALALPLVYPLPENPWFQAFYLAFGQAAIPEEIAKFAVLFFFCFRHSEFDEPMDGLVYGAAVLLGFAALENILYVSDGGLGVALVRAFTSVPTHALLGALMGYFLALSRFEPDRQRLFFTLALVVPMVLHGLYNYPLFLAALVVSVQFEDLFLGLPVLVVIAEYQVAVQLLKRVRKDQDDSVVLVHILGLPNEAETRMKTSSVIESAIGEARGVHKVERTALGLTAVRLRVHAATSADELAAYLEAWSQADRMLEESIFRREGLALRMSRRGLHTAYVEVILGNI